jgi:hypothetical protein
MPFVTAGAACKETGSSRAILIATRTQARGALPICYLLGGLTGPVLLLGVIGGVS